MCLSCRGDNVYFHWPGVDFFLSSVCFVLKWQDSLCWCVDKQAHVFVQYLSTTAATAKRQNKSKRGNRNGDNGIAPEINPLDNESL